jgi:lycopene cyclase domain-containing protein
MKRYSYAASLSAVFLIPALAIWYALGIRVPVVQMLIFVLLITVVGSVYDVWAARHGRHDTHWLWSFNKTNTVGIEILDLPVEEYLFYTFSSLYVVIAWEGRRVDG